MKVEDFRIKNGTEIDIPSLAWVGLVVDQTGPDVLISIPNERFAWFKRDQIEGRKVVR